MVLISSLFLGLICLGWLSCFVYCYNYYGSTDRNRINFKVWSLLSFLYAFENIIVIFTEYNCFHFSNTILFNLIYATEVVIVLLLSYMLHDQEYQVKSKTNLKLFRYCDLFLHILFKLFFILCLATRDMQSLVPILLLLCLTAIPKKCKLMGFIFLTHAVLIAIMRFFPSVLAELDIYWKMQLIILILSFFRVKELFNQEKVFNKSIK